MRRSSSHPAPVPSTGRCTARAPCSSRRCRCRAIPMCASRSRARIGSPPSCASTVPRSCTSPRRSCSAGAGSWPRSRSGSRRSRCTRPTSPRTRSATGCPGAAPALTRHLGRLHRRATVTLAPVDLRARSARELGVEDDRMRLWRRGVDTERFAPARRSERWRRSVARDDEVIVGYVGRLAPEKQVEDLRAIADLPRTRLVIIGDGPSRPALERMLPDARSPDSSAAMRSPRRWRASTCSCTPARARRSARPSRSRSRAGSRSSRPGAAVRSTSCARASTAGCTGRATSSSSATACATSWATMPSGGPSGSVRGTRCAAGAGTCSATSSSPTTRTRSPRAPRPCSRGERSTSEPVQPSERRRMPRPRRRPSRSCAASPSGRRDASAPGRGGHGAGRAALATLRRGRRLAHRGTLRHLPHAGGGVPRDGPIDSRCSWRSRRPPADPVAYANVAVRSRKVADAVDVQLPARDRASAPTS